MKNLNFIILIFFFGCTVQKNTLSDSETFSVGDTIYNVTTKNQYSIDKDTQNQNINNCLLCQVSKLPGIDIGSAGSFGSYNEDTAEIYIKGTQSPLYQQEVTFYVNGFRIGKFSELSGAVQASNIKSMRLLKGPQAAILYGEEGTCGVILIKTK